jgi:hypothetical protein
MFIDLIVGRRGTGKTSLLCDLAAEHQAQYGNAVLVQSAKTLGCRHPSVRLTWDFPEAVRWAYARRPAVICVDEYTAFKDDPNFIHILLYGRNDRVGLLMNAQRPRMFGTNLTSMANRVYVLQLTGKRDLIWLEENLGEEYAEAARKLDYYQYLVYPGAFDAKRLDSKDRGGDGEGEHGGSKRGVGRDEVPREELGPDRVDDPQQQGPGAPGGWGGAARDKADDEDLIGENNEFQGHGQHR